jgi:hypothetical protein
MSTPRVAAFLALFLASSSCVADDLKPHMQAVEKIRGRKFDGSVKNVSIDRSALPGLLREQMAKDLPYSLEEWVSVLRALQLVDEPPAEVLPKLLALYESQVLAFYDPHSHTYYSIKQMPEAMQKLGDRAMLEEGVAVHELMHAMQDQHFDAGKKIEALRRDTDATMAYHAVLEGEALLVMMSHMLGKSGMDMNELIRSEELVQMVLAAAQQEQAIDPSTPRYFAESLKFPYLGGLQFVIAAYRRGGWAELDKVHANPPRSTREVMHPEEYFAKSAPAPKFDPKAPASALTVEHMGEFHWAHLVGKDNARGWIDDRVVIGKDHSVSAETKWQSPEQAQRFADAYRAFLTKRGLTATVTRDGATVKASYAVTKPAAKAAA